MDSKLQTTKFSESKTSGSNALIFLAKIRYVIPRLCNCCVYHISAKYILSPKVNCIPNQNIERRTFFKLEMYKTQWGWILFKASYLFLYIGFLTFNTLRPEGLDVIWGCHLVSDPYFWIQINYKTKRILVSNKSIVGLPKGQLISKCSFGVFKLNQKPRKFL